MRRLPLPLSLLALALATLGAAPPVPASLPPPAAAPAPPPRPFRAAPLNVPGINGHMTDPTRKLSDDAKKEVEDRLTKIAEDTHIDVAGWITNAPDDQTEALGNEAYKRWSIGVWWDNGVFYAFPASGHVHIIQDPAHHELTPDEEKKIIAAENPSDDFQKRIDALEAATREIIVPKTTGRARPWGTNRPERGNYYLFGAAAVFLAAVALSFRKRKTSTPTPTATSTPDLDRDLDLGPDLDPGGDLDPEPGHGGASCRRGPTSSAGDRRQEWTPSVRATSRRRTNRAAPWSCGSCLAASSC
jgi:hypothetical protein